MSYSFTSGSPSVVFREFDLTGIVPAVASSDGAIAGVFKWGPIGKRVQVGAEDELYRRMGPPSNFNGETWFSAASFLAYTDSLYISRAANTSSSNGSIGALTAFANTGAVANVVAQVVLNEDDYTTKDGTFDTDIRWLAKYPGEMGNSLRVSQCDTADQFQSSVNLASYGNTVTFSLNIGSNTATVTILANSITLANTGALNLSGNLSVTDLIEVGNNTISKQFMKITAIDFDANNAQGNSTTGNSYITIHFEDELKLHTAISNTTAMNRYWEYYDLMDTAPGQSDFMASFGNTAANDELHIVIVDDKGKFSGAPGTVLESYKNLSRASDSKNIDNETNYYKTVINQQSQYVWLAADRTTAVSNTANNLASSTAATVESLTFTGGADGADEANVSIGVLATAWDQFKSSEDVDISLLITGKSRGGTAGGQLANYLVDNIAEVRKDCVVFTSPDHDDVVNNPNDEVDDITAYRNTLRSSSYQFLDSGYKYMYDRYNDVYRWIPLNGDMAGLCARTDITNDPWWSPGGYNRGKIKNVVKLAWNPKKYQRDRLYRAGVNPVFTEPLEGTLLLGDKTTLNKPSAFSRINVRRLFIVLEKAISIYSKYVLFEFNDDFTRAQFKATVNPYLREVKGRRGLTDYLVVCDESNNPGDIVDQYIFVADIYLKPARAINWVLLNFIAVPTGQSFKEVVGLTGAS